MGSAIGAFLHNVVTPESSSDRFVFHPASSPMFRCRKRRAVSSKKAKHEAWFNEDIWICIMSFLDAKSLLRLAVTNRQFCALAKDDVIWKSLFLRSRDIPTLSIDTKPAFSWMSLYLAACDGSHTYSFHDSEKHIDWMRIGVFCLESGEAVATDRLMDMKLISNKTNTSYSDNLLLKTYLISNVKKGFWIAGMRCDGSMGFYLCADRLRDLHLVHCPVCNLASCEGTMQTLDVRHWELFLNKEYKTGEWKFEQVYTRHVTSQCSEAAACIFDSNQLRNEGTQDVLNLSKWIATSGNWLPKGITSSHGAAACTNLHPNKAESRGTSSGIFFNAIYGVQALALSSKANESLMHLVGHSVHLHGFEITVTSQHLFALRDRFENEIAHHESGNGRSCSSNSSLPGACVTPARLTH